MLNPSQNVFLYPLAISFHPPFYLMIAIFFYFILNLESPASTVIWFLRCRILALFNFLLAFLALLFLYIYSIIAL